MPTRARGGVACEIRTPRWCPTDSASLELDGRAAPEGAAWRNQVLEAGAGTKQQSLHAGAGSLLQSPPLVNRDEHSLLNATARDDLRPLAESRIQEFTEPRLRVLELPFGHGAPPVHGQYHRTSQMSSHYERCVSPPTGLLPTEA